MYKDILSKLTNGVDLNAEEVSEIISDIREDRLTEGQISGFLVALVMKGTTLEETAYIARAMRENCIPILPAVEAEMSIPVAKHGSRSISSLSGSADVLEALGVNINLTPQQAAELIEQINIAFIYAPLFHPVMGKVLAPEAALGIKTIFYTIIGPLINPSFAPRHLLGVYKPELLEQVATVAKEIGYTRAMFVHGLDGLDEISLLGKTRIMELRDGEFNTYEIAPEDFGLQRCTLDQIRTGTPEENAATIRGVFDGTIRDARRDAVLLNAAGALIIGDKADGFADGITRVAEIIDSGQASAKLASLVEKSNAYLK